MTSSATIRFFILYTAFVVILIYLIQGNVLQPVRAALVRYGVNIDTALTILQIIILFFVPAIILAKLQVVPVNPDIATWFTDGEVINTFVFFLIYASCVGNLHNRQAYCPVCRISVSICNAGRTVL